MPKERVDVLAYKQGLFETREQAKRGVMAGLVVNVINGERYDKPGEKIDDGTELKLKGEKLRYVSRGGLKLEKALAVFNLSVEDMITIDIGASTGGFTQRATRLARHTSCGARPQRCRDRRGRCRDDIQACVGTPCPPTVRERCRVRP